MEEVEESGSPVGGFIWSGRKVNIYVNWNTREED